MNQQTQAVIDAIRAIGQIWPEDVQAITAALASKVANDINRHSRLHQIAAESLDDLACYLDDSISESEQAAAYEAPKLGYVYTVPNVEGVSLERAL